jgi:hypothetical protein
MTRSRPPTDEIKTEIYDSDGGRPTVELATKIGRQPRPPKLPAIDTEATEKTKRPSVEVAEATEISRHPPIEQGTPTDVNRAEPLRVISMKTPAELEAEKRSKLVPKAHIRSIAEVSGAHHKRSEMGFLALPRDAKQARGRRVVSNLYWAATVVAIALVVALALWFVTQR